MLITKEIFSKGKWNMNYEDYQRSFCPRCDNSKCEYRCSYDRLPESDGGKGLCPNLKHLKQ